jgi:ADP-ribose pyrophosphatase YjhB (NUDIX family)
MKKETLTAPASSICDKTAAQSSKLKAQSKPAEAFDITTDSSPIGHSGPLAMNELINKAARLFYKLGYRALLILWFFTRPTVYGVYIAVWHQEKLLVIKNSYKKRFTIPCGRIKRGEDRAEAAVRELYEEVNLKLEKEQLTFVGEFKGQHKHATDIGIFFEITMTEMPQVQVDKREVVWARFLPLHQINDLKLNPTVETWLNQRFSLAEQQTQKPDHENTK